MGADGKVLGVLEEALAGGILPQAVGEAGHGVEPAPCMAALHMRQRSARDSVGQTSGATQCCLNLGFSERFGNSRRTGGTAPSWLSFIGHTTDSLWSVDLVRCESVVLRSDWVLVVMDQCTRRLVGVGVHRGPVTGADLCRMFNAAMQGRGAPRHLSTDHDPLFEAHRWTANLRILEIDAIKTVPHVPRSHPFVERLIGTARRESLDHVLFWNARDLERKLADFQADYNEVRSHASLKGHTPSTFAGGQMVARAELNNVRWVSDCRGLVQLPVAA